MEINRITVCMQTRGLKCDKELSFPQISLRQTFNIAPFAPKVFHLNELNSHHLHSLWWREACIFLFFHLEFPLQVFFRNSQKL